MRILLVEDNLVNQKVAIRLLERFGYRIDVASNGAEAVVSALRQPYNLILMDVQMPEMDGYEATRAIRQRLVNGARPFIVAMTAAAMREDQELALAAGMDSFISKPVQIEELVSRLKEYSEASRDTAMAI